MGVLFLILAAMNGAAEAGAASFRALQKLFFYIGGFWSAGTCFFLKEFTGISGCTGGGLCCIGDSPIPLLLAMLSQASRYRWAATTAASVYTVFLIGEF